MISDEARRQLEASTGFEIRDGLVWLRDPRWAGAGLRAAPDAEADVRAQPGEAADDDAGSRVRVCAVAE
jgi:hypothetical protein